MSNWLEVFPVLGMFPGLTEGLLFVTAAVVVFLWMCGRHRAQRATKQRWLIDTILVIVAGPLVALSIFGVVWIVDPPHPLDTMYHLCAILLVGCVASAIAACAYSVAWLAMRKAKPHASSDGTDMNSHDRPHGR